MEPTYIREALYLYMEIVGQRLKLLRESVKLTQAKIAILIGIQQR